MNISVYSFVDFFKQKLIHPSELPEYWQSMSGFGFWLPLNNDSLQTFYQFKCASWKRKTSYYMDLVKVDEKHYQLDYEPNWLFELKTDERMYSGNLHSKLKIDQAQKFIEVVPVNDLLIDILCEKFDCVLCGENPLD